MVVIAANVGGGGGWCRGCSGYANRDIMSRCLAEVNNALVDQIDPDIMAAYMME
jgi:hypothetical protein